MDRQQNVKMSRLFFEAEFITPATYEELMIEQGAREQTWMQFLEQDITSSTFRMRGRKDSGINQVDRLADPIQIYLPEIIYLTSTFTPDPLETLSFLVEEGVVTPTVADSYESRAEEEKGGLLNILIEERAISPRVLAELNRGRLHTKAREIRLQAASDVLVYNDVIDSDELAFLLNKAHHVETPFYEELQSVISAKQLKRLLYEGLEFPEIELEEETILEEWSDLFPLELIARLRFFPVELEDNHCTLAVDDPLDFSIADALSIITPCSFSQVGCKDASLQRCLEALLPNSGESFAPEILDTDFSESNLFNRELLSASELQDEEFSAVEVVRRLLESAVSNGATDIHVERVNNILRARLRVDGMLRTVLETPMAMAEKVISRIKVLCNIDVTERRRPQDGHFTIHDQTHRIDFRVSTLPTTEGEKLVLRVLDAANIVRGFDDLGMNEEQKEIFLEAIDKPLGLILVTGPTGSGKTSTLYSGLSLLNTSERNIITIEDPVEYRLDGVAQVHVDNNIELTFASGLRASLRQDPDVIMVGEIRDPETAGIAMRASLTGHLVFSTLHSNTAVAAIAALRHLGTPSYLIASSLLLVIAQRLLRKICPNCREVVEPAVSLIKDLELEDNFSDPFFAGTGCQSCFFDGYRGRTGIYEMLMLDNRLKRSIVEEMDEVLLREQALMQGFLPMKAHAREKVIQGLTSPEEAMQVSYLPA
jgi:type IV pilus assembly protein PilB